MQGTWKESVGGYSPKNIKRKKQTRKHTLKDKLNNLVLVSYKEKSKTENSIRFEPVVVRKRIYKNELEIQPMLISFLVRVRYRSDFVKGSEGYEKYEEILLDVYYQHDDKTGHKEAVVKSSGKPLMEHLALKKRIEEELEVGDVSKTNLSFIFDLSIEKIRETGFKLFEGEGLDGCEVKEEELDNFCYRPKLYVYGKFVPYHYMYYRYGRSNKFSKKTGSSKTRRRVKVKVKTGRYEECYKEDYYRRHEWY